MSKHAEYWQGFRIEYTGKVERLYGGTFREAIILEGCRKGEVILVKGEA